jgi:hypothetical protein
LTTTGVHHVQSVAPVVHTNVVNTGLVGTNFTGGLVGSRFTGGVRTSHLHTGTGFVGNTLRTSHQYVAQAPVHHHHVAQVQAPVHHHHVQPVH